MNSDKPAPRYSRQFAIFKDGCRVPEEWIKWVMAFREIENLMTLKEPADKIRMFQTLLKGQALSYFEYYFRKRLEAEDPELPDYEIIEVVLRNIGLENVPKLKIHVQKYYTRQSRDL
jgi:hypothetical protein